MLFLPSADLCCYYNRSIQQASLSTQMMLLPTDIICMSDFVNLPSLVVVFLSTNCLYSRQSFFQHAFFLAMMLPMHSLPLFKEMLLSATCGSAVANNLPFFVAMSLTTTCLSLFEEVLLLIVMLLWITQQPVIIVRSDVGRSSTAEDLEPVNSQTSQSASLASMDSMERSYRYALRCSDFAFFLQSWYA